MRITSRRNAIKTGLLAGIGAGFYPALKGVTPDTPFIKPLKKSGPEIINCYYYAPHNHCLLTKHIEYDLANMVQMGANTVSFCLQEEQLYNWHSGRTRNFIALAHKHGLKVFSVPNRWAGILAGWLDGYSRWSINNQDTWYEKSEYRSKGYSDPEHPKVADHYKKHLKVMIEDFEVDGVIWDEPRPFHEKGIMDFLDEMSSYCKDIRSDIVTNIFAEAGALHQAEWYAEMKYIDYAGADGHLRSESHVMHRMKNTIFTAYDHFNPILKKAGKKTFYLVEGQRHRDEDLDNYLENLDKAFSLEMDQLMFYYSAHEMSFEKEDVFNKETWKAIAKVAGV